MGVFNKTHVEHSVIAVAVQLTLFSIPLGAVNLWLCGAVACAVFFGREVAQHEYKGGGPNNVSPLYGLTNHWSVDSILDVAVPALACTFVAAAGMALGVFLL